MDYEKEQEARVVWYYYVEKLTQKDISEVLNISRMRVLRLLDKAEKDNLIRFTIQDKYRGRLNIEKKLKEIYKLEDVFVIPEVSDDQSKMNSSLAHAAAMYIENHFEQNSVINIGYGDSVSRTVKELSANLDVKRTFVSLTGGVSLYLVNSNINPGSAQLYLIPTPLITSTEEMLEAIKNEKAVINISRMHDEAACTIVGIGSMSDNATVVKTGILSANDFNYLKMKGAIGDILAHFLNDKGEVIQEELEKRIISCSLEKLKDLKNVIAVAGGKSKHEAIKGALASGCINILITDESTAQQLVSDFSEND
jgi:lsr operon transcriptional repressor